MVSNVPLDLNVLVDVVLAAVSARRQAACCGDAQDMLKSPLASVVN